MQAQPYFYAEHSGGEIDLLLVDGLDVRQTIEIKLGGLNNLTKISKVLHRSFIDADRIVVSGSTDKSLQLSENMELMPVEHYFKHQFNSKG